MRSLESTKKNKKYTQRVSAYTWGIYLKKQDIEVLANMANM